MKTLHDEINDKDVLDLFSNAKDEYEIKLSSSDILNKFQANQQKNTSAIGEPKENVSKKKKKWFIPLVSSLSTLAVATVSIGLFFGITATRGGNGGNSSGSDGTIVIPNPDLDLRYTKTITDELITFKNFNVDENNTTYSTNQLLLSKLSLKSNNDKIPDNIFSDVASQFDRRKEGILDTFNLKDNTSTVKINDPEIEIDGTKYMYTMSFEGDYINEYFLFNIKETKNKQNKTKSTYSGVYMQKTSDEIDYAKDTPTYHVEFKNEAEVDKNETEVELKGTFKPFASNPDKRVIVIETEKENEETESETSYSFYEYENEDVFNKDDDNYKFYIEYSLEIDTDKNEEELEVEVYENNVKYNFEDIIRDSTKTTFESFRFKYRADNQKDHYDNHIYMKDNEYFKDQQFTNKIEF